MHKGQALCVGLGREGCAPFERGSEEALGEGIGHDDHGGLDGGSDDAEGLELRSHHSGNTSYTGDRDSQYCCRLRAGLVECSIHAVSV
eukprot:1162046-Pelagomonas_calceolata.AAC.7